MKSRLGELETQGKRIKIFSRRYRRFSQNFAYGKIAIETAKGAEQAQRAQKYNIYNHRFTYFAAKKIIPKE